VVDAGHGALMRVSHFSAIDPGQNEEINRAEHKTRRQQVGKEDIAEELFHGFPRPAFRRRSAGSA
jgi:hypothetical protein